jgi:hypothetical protein
MWVLHYSQEVIANTQNHLPDRADNIRTSLAKGQSLAPLQNFNASSCHAGAIQALHGRLLICLPSCYHTFIFFTPTMSTTFWSRSNEQHQQKQEDQDDRASDSKISEKDQVAPRANDADLNPGELTFEEGAILLPFQQFYLSDILQIPPGVWVVTLV